MPSETTPIQNAKAPSLTRAPSRAVAVLLAALVLAAWLSAGAAPLRDAAAGARDPVDFARDYVTARARLDDGRGAPPPEGEAGNVRAARYGAPEVLLYGAYYHAHPPPTRLPVRPLGLLPWRTAALVWAAASLAALAWLVTSLYRIAARGGAPSPARVALATVVLALWPPVLHCLEKGQWSIALAALLAAGLVALEADRPRRAGVLFGLAAAIKATPVVLLVLLALRFRRGARAMVATIALAVAASLAVDGLAPWSAFVAGAGHNAAIWAPWTANTASPAAVYARLFGAPGPFARPLVAAPALSTLAFALTSLALVAAALLALRPRPARPSPPTGPSPSSVSPASPAPTGPSSATLAAWLTLPVLLNPLGWSHVLVMLLAPLIVALRDGTDGTRRLALIVLVLVTVPRLALARLAGPLPIAPGRGLVLGVHAAAAVILFVGLLAVRRAGPPTPAPHSHY